MKSTVIATNETRVITLPIKSRLIERNPIATVPLAHRYVRRTVSKAEPI